MTATPDAPATENSARRYSRMSTKPETSDARGPRAAAGSAALPGARAFCVAWAFKKGGARGNGSPTTEENARAWADYANNMYPWITHRAVPVT